MDQGGWRSAAGVACQIIADPHLLGPEIRIMALDRAQLQILFLLTGAVIPASVMDSIVN
jgi:hypothetical protein